jgi:glutathionylspermidine synthase
MRKIQLAERPDWQSLAADVGFTFAEMYGEPYWEEKSAYQFTLRQIEDDIEDPSTELHAMCREAVAAIVVSDEMMSKLAIPPEHHDLVAASWHRGDPEIYGRFDLAYDGTGPAKLLEYNADTPTSLYESASFQWKWLEDQIANGVLSPADDQFNGIHDALVARFRDLFAANTDLHFAAIADNPEDYATVEAMAWAAREAGLGAHFCDLKKIGISEDGNFVDAEDRVIGILVKLYPWENLFRDPFARHLTTAGCLFLEPAWKAVVSNKGLLPIIWQMFEGHPNLLPAFFESDVRDALAGHGQARPHIAAAFDRAAPLLRSGHVTKPLFSREGASISILQNGQITEASSNHDYAEHPKIVQAYHQLPQFDGFHPVVGAWIVGHACAGIGLREDRSRITQDLSRFKPHFIRD